MQGKHRRPGTEGWEQQCAGNKKVEEYHLHIPVKNKYSFPSQINKLTSVYPLIGDKLRHNIIKVAVKPQAAGECVMTQFIINKRTDA